MVIEIESYQGDTLLYGPEISFLDFKEQIKTVENLYDRKEDNFVALLCRIYHWAVIKDELEPQYVYDRDIKKERNAAGWKLRTKRSDMRQR